nr:VOC family protein [uncultured Halomonas sp.]
MVTGLDHLVVTVTDIARAVDFYTRVLGLEARYQEAERVDLIVGDMALRLHQTDAASTPKAAHPTPGSIDLCVRSVLSLEEVQAHLDTLKIPVEQGPVPRRGIQGPIISLYLRDPDGNLIEICRPDR